MSLSLDREAKAAPFHQLRTETPAAPEAQLPMQVIRRNGTVSKFDAGKIAVAMTKAFLAVEGHAAAASRRVHEVVEQLTAEVVSALSRRMSEGRTHRGRAGSGRTGADAQRAPQGGARLRAVP
jgi:ribonucleoside-diphosphate reductase alpha chain